ncbi:RING/U-box superfamily protein [Salix suchowensis]|nr:RING/U-box superfamily protein [Salix suchowensis]
MIMKDEVEMVMSRVANCVATAADCRSTIVVMVVFFAIRLCARFFWRKNHIPSFTFRRKHYPGKNGDKNRNHETPYCVVCLHEAVDGERLRRLLKCEHCFHAACIDAWFQSHPTCPLCRNQVFLRRDHQHQNQKRSLFFPFLSFLQQNQL